MENRNYKLVVFEDNDALRDSVQLLIDSDDTFKVVGTFKSLHNCVENLKELQPDVIIMDIGLPEISGVEGAKMIKANMPQVEIIMHTVFEDTERIFESLCAGASGYLLKKDSPTKLIASIYEVLQGGSPMSPAIARQVVQSFSQPINTIKYDLTNREKEILHFLVKGYSYKMIARECFISLETVKSHLKKVYAKLHVNCGTEAVAVALKNRIV